MEFENNVEEVVVDRAIIYVSTVCYRYEIAVFDPIFLRILYLKYVGELK